MGAVCAGAIALAARRAGALTAGGALAAGIVGTLTYAGGTLGFTLVLLAFFVSSVALSRYGRARKRALTDIGKGGARDALQVLANGGAATLCAVLFAATHDARWGFAFAGAYAAATADTWATEIGTLARQAPRSILTGRPVAPGLSGGVTLAGTLAEVGGALWIGLIGPLGIVLGTAHCIGVACAFGWPVPNGSPWPLLAAAIPLAGVAGATLDSVLGATIQELRHCDRCGRACETNPHLCGTPTRRVRGIPGLSNDLVNLAATSSGALIAFALT